MSESWRDRDRRVLWHPFTQMRDWAREDPVIVARGDGCWLVDVDGNRFLDGVSSLWCNVHGHHVPEIDAAVRDQLGRIAHSTMLGLSATPAIELAERLVALAPPGLTRVFYSDSGATAVEIALKMAFQFWQHTGQPERTHFVTFEGAYHGDTIGAVSLGGIPLFHQLFKPLLFDTLRVPAPTCLRCPLGRSYPSCETACLEPLESLLAGRGGEVAAVVIEPVMQGAAGMIAQPAGFLARVRAACDRAGTLLVCDEVATGFGRTGAMFACDAERVSPDLLTVAKGLTGGYLPLAATLATERIYEAFLGEVEQARTFFHGHTYTGNALACAAALASLELFASRDLLAHVRAMSARLAERLAPLGLHPNVAEIRQRGLMVGVELVADRATNAPHPSTDRVPARIVRAARRRGVILRPLGNVMVLMPPLAISADELDLLVSCLTTSIEEVLPSSASS